ncbi:MAG TPA: HD domain-containing protein [Humidesulfovibrio sp.]|uniref:HD domain-containing protein n=1 Tax=Humidesulfovibrio sp. TaxID=2910988 RepID=UPI002D0DB150|nr:HD domain-containing protein [Humidesulfovibrio sp.]HWR04977.1 HD domain-containing protein [Humidesulfovibrio sp.]
MPCSDEPLVTAQPDEALVRLVGQRFEAFALPFLDDQGDGFAYTLKMAHTKRVLGLAETICAEEALPREVALAARLGAQLHDVGRFPQYRQYRTFRDADSANHAALSVAHILREKLLGGVPARIRRLTLGAVYLHNKRSLPPIASSALRDAARVVRDSDKLDIYSVMIAHFAQKNPKHPEVALNVVDAPDTYTPSVLDALCRRERGDYRTIVYINDFKLMTIGWLYDMNFRASCRLLKERGYLETLFATLPRDEKIDGFHAQINTDLAQRLDHA